MRPEPSNCETSSLSTAHTRSNLKVIGAGDLSKAAWLCREISRFVNISGSEPRDLNIKMATKARINRFASIESVYSVALDEDKLGAL